MSSEKKLELHTDFMRTKRECGRFYGDFFYKKDIKILKNDYLIEVIGLYSRIKNLAIESAKRSGFTQPEMYSVKAMFSLLLEAMQDILDCRSVRFARQIGSNNGGANNVRTRRFSV